MSFLMRAQLPDQPGSLGALASALGRAGADILSVDVVDRGSGSAVDDLVVEVPSGVQPDELITAAESVAGVMVDAIRPYAGVLDTHRELELVERIADDPKTGMQQLVEHAPKIIRSGWAAVYELDTGGVARRTHASAASPETALTTTPWLPLQHGEVLEAEAEWVPGTWQELGTELAVVPLLAPERGLLVGRPGGPGFRTSEVARLEHLTGIVAVVLRQGGG